MSESNGEAQPRRAPYEPPRIEVVGTLEELTLAGEGTQADGFGFLPRISP